MWRLFKLGYQHEPRLLVTAFVLSLLSALPDALIALWLALLGKGVVGDDQRLVVAAAVGLGTSAMLTWLLRVLSTRLQRRPPVTNGEDDLIEHLAYWNDEPQRTAADVAMFLHQLAVEASTPQRHLVVAA